MPWLDPKKKRAYDRRWRRSEDGKRAALRYRLKYNYSVSLEWWDDLVKRQKDRCAICRKVRPLLLDHDHCTGLPRGALCRPCNAMLGFVHDDPSVLRRAARYLEGFGPTGSNYVKIDGQRQRLPEIERVYR